MDLYWLLTVISAVGLVLAFVFGLPRALYTFYIQWKAVRNIPGLPTHWLLGNAHQVARMFQHEEEAMKFLKFICDNKFKITSLWIGPFQPLVGIHHCSLVGKVFKLPKHKDVYRLLKPWLGDGLLISEGNKWFRNRKLLTPAFHYEILNPYISVYNSCIQVLLDKWIMSAKGNDPVRLFDSICLLSLDIILQCSFSYKSNCQDTEQRHPYIQAIQDIGVLTTSRFISPFYRIDWIFYLSPSGRKYKELCKFVHDHSRMVIQERKKELELGKEERSLSESQVKAKKKGKYLDFLDILLTARDEEGNGLTDQEIQDEVDTFMFEGHDTTTSGMCWTLYCLAKHPEHQDKVREEVRNVLMGRDWLEYDDLKELKYTQWCIKEAMRLYPPVFLVTRQATGNLELEGHQIPEGMAVNINVRTIHRDPDTWENPDEYDPLRFHPSNAEGRHPFAYIPFSGGQRNCIGQNFALNEERVVIASIVNRFKLSLVEGHKVETMPNLVLRSKEDIKVLLEPLV